jgi:EF-P beta-lysylation protein EpmB
MNLSNSSKQDWQTALMNGVTEPEELLTLLELDPQFLAAAKAAANYFPLKVPRSFIARMEKGNINDPLLQQILPIHAELTETSGYSRDPLNETSTNPLPGLLHKYHGRVLFTLTGACGINCRYCFRREFPYEKNNPGREGWNQVIDYIAKDASISEVILSGGDPLVVNDLALENLIKKLAALSHVQRLRIHSRMPIVLPERITPEFITLLTQNRLKTILVVHCNHPQEINQDVIEAMRRLAYAGVTLLNQSVLLKGINDQTEVLIALSEKLFDAGIHPYYLHVLDKVRGAAHFDLDLAIARKLHWEMAQRLPGYLVPKLACEQPGAPAKLLLGSWELYTA